VVALHESVEFPLPVAIEVGTRPQFNPVVGLTVSLRLTVAVKPLSGLIVIVELRMEPMFPLRLDGEAVTAKSSIENVTLAEWDRVPLVPVIDNEYVPATVELQDTEAVPEAVRKPGEIELHERPAGIVSVNETVPVKPFM